MKKQGQQLFSLLAAASMMLSLPAAAAPRPDSGSVLENISKPVVEGTVKPAPHIGIERPGSPGATQGQAKIQVNSFTISGDAQVEKDKLLALLSKWAGRELTLAQIDEAAQTLTRHLRQEGYLVAFAYVPAQDVQNGVVDITVVLGRYGQIRVSGTGLDEQRVRKLFTAAQHGRIIERALLERALLLASDLHGVGIKATLAPGADAGTADLLLVVSELDKVSGVYYADNWGNTYSGKNRFGIQASINNPGRTGDQLSFGGLLSEENRLTDWDIAYGAPLGYDGTNVRLHHTQLHYSLGEDFAYLNAAGKAVTDGITVSYPFIRSHDINLYGSFGYEHKTLKDDIASAGTFSRKTSNLWNASLSGDYRDQWHGGGVNQYSLTHYRGSLAIEDADTQASDASAANTAGHFSKTVLTYQRQQYVAPRVNLYLNYTGQWADKNLDSSEKIFLGGANGVRAFAQGEGSGDEGCRLTGEFRWLVPGWSTPKTAVSLAAFYDYGHVMINKQTWAGAGDNGRTMQGAGIGVLWVRSNATSVRFDYAWKTDDSQSPSSEGSNGRLWLQVVKSF